jgi:chromosome segregation protein
MVGFKSFADKTRVEFEPGITAIVGPNGCGKSNIADAIRWSLGEMSAKTLRSQQMMDVIFNGTANRPSQGLSEVALTFDNASHQIPLDYSEVTVARRLFRSGESEYSINKTQCRLRDVRELFLDTGIGNEGYYVMAQGKIEFILSSRPEERRELFEEAAGVAKYKARRDEALRKLNKVEQDMLRLNDSLAIYKQQMDSLESAVRKARQHQKLQEELRTLEISSFVHGFQKAQTDWESVHTRQQEEQERLSRLQEDVTVRETRLSEARTLSEQLELDVLERQKTVAQMESDWAKTEAERHAAQERQGELEQAQKRLEQESVQLQSSVEEWRQTQAALQQDVAALRGQFHERNEKFKHENERGRVEQQGAHQKQKELEQTKARLLELARLVGHHRNETVRLTSLSIRHEESSKAKQRELEKVQTRRSGLEEQLQQQGQLAQSTQDRLRSAQSRLSELDAQQQKDRDALADVEKNIQELRERLARLGAEKIALERWLQQDPVALAASALRQASLPGIHGPVSDLLRTSNPYQRLLDRALGDRAHYFVAESLNDAQAAVRFLSDEHKGWATFLILDRLMQSQDLPPLDEHFGSRSLAVQVDCDLMFNPVKQFLLSKTYYVGVTLFEESILQGGADPEGVSFQATPADLSRLQQELTQDQQSLGQFETQRQGLHEAVSQRETERGPIQAELSQIQVVVQVQQETLNRLREDLQMIGTEERLLERERQEALQAIAQAQKALQQEEILLTTLEEEDKTLQQTLQSQDSALHELRQKIQSQQSAIAQLRVEAETMRERLLGKEKEEENARGRLGTVEHRIGQIQEEQAQNAERLSQVIATQTEKTQALESLQTVRQSQGASLTELLSQREGLQGQLHQQEQDLSAARQALAQAQTQAQEAEFQVRTLDQERTRLEQILRDTYQLSLEEARSSHGEIQPNPEELTRIRRRLESLGAVNLAAPEEHAQLEERYHFLLTQQQDLLKAKEDLHQAISKINATTREHFRTTFDQVRAHFQTLYQTLFQGGEADLILTDEHNLLETGIEIMAQPPGKKLQNITLLSGGEKALTAIALLFAFFMVKPSPFCLLDEVDAPLDEANVGRFLRMVKSFSEKTQFIVITHNKRTMEMADVLYGVTMAELGVSSLISVKLQERKPADVVAA